VNSEFYSPLNYAPQYYNGSGNRASANPVSVVAGSTTPSINAEMHEGGKITGTVTDAVTHEPVEGVEECVSKIGDAQEEEEYFYCGYSNSSGQYEVKALGTGSYTVEFRESYYQPSEIKYARQYYNNKITRGAAEAVSVTAGATSININAAMQEGGRITGTITDASTASPIEDAEACVVKPGEEEEYFACGYSGVLGNYMIAGISAGPYEVVFHGPYGTSYADQYYNGKASIGEGTSLPVTVGSTTTNINASLTQVAPPPAQPVNTVSPVLSGTPAVGQTLSCSTGSWEHSPTSYEYVWLRGATAISGAALGTYQVQAADQGFSITCEVTAINASGHATAASNFLAVPAAAEAPVNTLAPVLSGTPAVGQTLSCSNGSWDNSPTGFAYAWRRDGSLISGQLASSYTVQSGDAAHGINCEVIASNGGGSASAVSNTLNVPAPPVEEKATTPEPPAPAPPPAPASHGSTGVADAPSVATVSNGGEVLIPLTCSGSQSCEGTLELFALSTPEAKGQSSRLSRSRKGSHGVLIGKGKFSVSPGHRATVKVKLNGKGKSLVHHAGLSGLRVELTGTGIKRRTVKIKTGGSGSRHHHRAP